MSHQRARIKLSMVMATAMAVSSTAWAAGSITPPPPQRNSSPAIIGTVSMVPAARCADPQSCYYADVYFEGYCNGEAFTISIDGFDIIGPFSQISESLMEGYYLGDVENVLPPLMRCHNPSGLVKLNTVMNFRKSTDRVVADIVFLFQTSDPGQGRH
jgi:hypothetical protein